MGRFRSSGPPSDSSQGRRYEALPANGADDDSDHEDRESLGTEVVSPVATSPTRTAAATTTLTSPVGSGPPPAPTGQRSSAIAASLSSSTARSPAQRSSDQSQTATHHDALDMTQAADTAAVARSSNQDDTDATSSSLASAEDRSTETKKDTVAPETDELTTSSSTDAPLDDLGPDAMSVRILDLNGKFFNIACALDWRVSRMKQRVLESTDVPVASQRLIYRGRVLEDDSCLGDYKVEDGHTIHLFVRHAPTPDADAAATDATATTASSSLTGARLDDGMTIVHISNDVISSAVFPSDSARRVDPLMLDSPLGNCARRVKLWSSFLLIIYTMKVMGQFALLANDQQLRSQQAQAQAASGPDSAAAAAAAAAAEREDQRERMYDYPEYYHQDPVAGVIELLIHAFGVYVGGVGFKAAHDTDIRPIRFFCRGVVWLAVLTIAEQIYITIQISNSDIPNERIRFAYGAQAPSKDDIVSANIFQAIMLVIMWVIAIRHAYWHQAEVNAYNQSFAVAAMNAVPPAHLPPAELV